MDGPCRRLSRRGAGRAVSGVPEIAGRSPNTVRSYARALALWWTFLERRAQAWDAIGVTELGTFVGKLRRGGVAEDVVALYGRPTRPWPAGSTRSWASTAITPHAGPVAGRPVRGTPTPHTRRMTTDWQDEPRVQRGDIKFPP
ncbi:MULTISPECIES: site-specific integrase [unclassified Streptomyces]|uniref:site-specific integrase n=1 Tax=unclassified Streptomyces TaxID=2593676 RepID=UPI00338FE73A